MDAPSGVCYRTCLLLPLRSSYDGIVGDLVFLPEALSENLTTFEWYA